MRKIIYRIFTWIQHLLLKKEGYVLGNNVIISNKGVRKIGKGKIFRSDNVNINSEVMLVASRDITIGKNSTLAYRVTINTSANPNAQYSELSKIYPPAYKEVHIGENV